MRVIYIDTVRLELFIIYHGGLVGKCENWSILCYNPIVSSYLWYKEFGISYWYYKNMRLIV